MAEHLRQHPGRYWLGVVAIMAAVLGNGPVVMSSGFSLYTVTNGAIDAGTFVPLT